MTYHRDRQSSTQDVADGGSVDGRPQVVDLGRDGPSVIDRPMGVYGIVNDCWERPIVEAGPFGPDKGEAGKFLLLPRNWLLKKELTLTK